MEYEDMLKRAVRNQPARSEARFEVPNAVVYAEKRRTTIRNFAEIARTLRRDPADLAKYMFKALAVPGSISNSELVLQSKVPPSLINQRVREYTKEFVICNECGKPDTSLQKVDNYLFLKCDACGARRSVARV